MATDERWPSGCPAHALLAARDAAPSCPGRRGLLLGLAGSTLALGAGPAASAEMPVHAGGDGTQDRQPFYGAHQSGIVNPEPAAALVVSFDVLADGRPELVRLMRLLTERFAFLTQGGEVTVVDPKLPPPDSGLLGPKVFPDNLTMTVALGASLFDDRFGLKGQKPKRLVAMTEFPNDGLDAACCHGDLLVQICSNTAETNIHALRDLMKHTPDSLAIRWKQEGFLPPHTVKALGKDTVRNLLGFKDGTANLDAADRALMERIVWVGKGADEPAWTQGGSYQVVRLIRTLVERWDRTPLREQETIIGRDKASGAPLGLTQERDDPNYAGDPTGKRVPLDAHIRRANPRTPETAANLILRRPFNYSNGLTKAGQLDMGLLFVCFQNDLDAGFLTVQARLNGEPLEEYIKPVGGGYFFALPGAPAAGHYLGQPLLEGTV
ncbi:MAG TPA: iron uptake transporter deferrochelatase/peroxidase subunit [Lichenihabitans sp.]|jgi:deferrochelatase/peroxidase EfeB|nr:iron uptake transporter deferrochelatase/peroxidase subunit [Lichenihabitans sp.]